MINLQPAALTPGVSLLHPLRHPQTGHVLVATGVILDETLLAKIRRMGLEALALSCMAPVTKAVSQPEAPMAVADRPEETLPSLQDQVQELEERLIDDGDLETAAVDPSQPRTLRLAEGIIDVILNRLSSQAPDAMSDLRVSGRGALYSTINVFLLSAQIGLALELDRPQLVALCQAALLHNLGKRRLENQFAFHSGPLTETESRMVQRDLEYGLSLLRERYPQFLSDHVDIYMGIRHQRERWDGTGYPQRRSGDEIPLISRILAVATMYDTLTADHGNQARLLAGDAYVAMLAQSGIAFDPEVVAAFSRAIAPYPLGSVLQLEFGQVVQVVQRGSDVLHPIVQLGFGDGKFDLGQADAPQIAKQFYGRRHPRVACSVPVEIMIPGEDCWYPAESVNVSLGGACLQLQQACLPGEHVRLRFQVEGERVLEFIGVMAWSSDPISDTPTVGIAFAPLSRATYSALEQFIARCARGG